jgi:hypothetical protein
MLSSMVTLFGVPFKPHVLLPVDAGTGKATLRPQLTCADKLVFLKKENAYRTLSQQSGL